MLMKSLLSFCLFVFSFSSLHAHDECEYYEIELSDFDAKDEEKKLLVDAIASTFSYLTIVKMALYKSIEHPLPLFDSAAVGVAIGRIDDAVGKLFSILKIRTLNDYKSKIFNELYKELRTYYVDKIQQSNNSKEDLRRCIKIIRDGGFDNIFLLPYWHQQCQEIRADWKKTLKTVPKLERSSECRIL